MKNSLFLFSGPRPFVSALLFLIFLLGCATPPAFDPENFWSFLEKELQRPFDPQTAPVNVKLYHVFLKEGVRNKSRLLPCPKERLEKIVRAIARGQFYYFVSPYEEYRKDMAMYYEWFDEIRGILEAQGENARGHFQEFDDLRALLQKVEGKNERAPSLLPKLLEFLDEQFERDFDELFSKLSAPYEVGGAIQYTERGIEIEFVEDPVRSKTMKHLEEFRRNDFTHLDSLRERFVQRFLLQERGTDESTRLYVSVVMKEIHRLFDQISSLSKWDKNRDVPAIEEAKEKLLGFGLESKLLRYSYFMDREAYLQREETAFLFHTHPHDPRIHYHKRPSGQDKIITMRTGPGIVFDVHEEYVDVYCVIAGKSQFVKRYSKTLDR